MEIDKDIEKMTENGSRSEDGKENEKAKEKDKEKENEEGDKQKEKEKEKGKGKDPQIEKEKEKGKETEKGKEKETEKITSNRMEIEKRLSREKEKSTQMEMDEGDDQYESDLDITSQKEKVVYHTLKVSLRDETTDTSSITTSQSQTLPSSIDSPTPWLTIDGQINPQLFNVRRKKISILLIHLFILNDLLN